MSVAQKIKDLALSKSDKTLRKHGIVDNEGDITGDGREVILNIILDEYKDTVVAKLEALEAEEKRNKKEKK